MERRLKTTMMTMMMTVKNKKKNKCLGNGSKGKGKAVGHCKKKENKSKYFFDADDAKAFKAAFSAIGTEIAQNTIRIKS